MPNNYASIHVMQLSNPKRLAASHLHLFAHYLNMYDRSGTLAKIFCTLREMFSDSKRISWALFMADLADGAAALGWRISKSLFSRLRLSSTGEERRDELVAGVDDETDTTADMSGLCVAMSLTATMHCKMVREFLTSACLRSEYQF